MWLKGPTWAGDSNAGEEDMSVKAAVISEIEQIASDNKRSLPPLTDDLVLIGRLAATSKPYRNAGLSLVADSPKL